MLQLLVNKADLRDVRIVEAPDEPLPGGQARFHIDLFALTTNNISYAAMGGPPLNYWEFFPADDAWGKPPCWAFGTITQFPAADTLDRTKWACRRSRTGVGPTGTSLFVTSHFPAPRAG